MPLDQGVVGFVLIGKTLDMVEDVAHLRDVLGHDPQLLLGVAEALSFYVFDFIHCVLLLFPPFEFFVQKVEDHKIETPHVISPRQVLSKISAKSVLTILLWALREANETVPLKSAFFLWATGFENSSKCFLASPKSTM